VVEALQSNVALHTLVLEHNGLSAEGGKAMAYALRTNHVLQNLDLGYNEIGSEGGKAIAEALQANHTVKTLNLTDCHMDAPTEKALRKVWGNMGGLSL